MRICRFDDNRLGVVVGDEVRDVTAILEHLPPLSWPVPPGDHFFNHFEVLRPRIEAAAADAPSRPLKGAKLLSPVANPGKIVAAPVNYQLHLDESRADTQIKSRGYRIELGEIVAALIPSDFGDPEATVKTIRHRGSAVVFEPAKGHA
jgi:hypothetical protein